MYLPIALPPLDPPLIKKDVWLVVVVRIAVAMDFFGVPALKLFGICLITFLFGRKVEVAIT